MSNTTPQLPSDFFSANSLFTLSGSACAVWIFCLVLSAIIPANSLSVYHWRLIALVFSEFLAVAIVLQQKNNSSIKWLIGLINGLLIFINASGINAVSTGLAFENKNSMKMEKMSYLGAHDKIAASMHIFNHEISWWPDLNILHEKDSLEKTNVALVRKNEQIEKSYNSFKKNCVISNPNITDVLKRDSILNEKVSKIERENVLLKSRLENLDSKHAMDRKLATQDESIKIDNEVGHNELLTLKKNLTDCQEENSDLMKKLNKIKNLNQLLREADKYGL